VRIKWISSELDAAQMEKEIQGVDRVIIPGGFGIRGLEGMIRAVSLAKNYNKKVLGICLGFQVIVIEHARTVCQLPQASSTEFNPATPYPVIISVADTKVLGSTMRLGAMQVTYNGLMENMYAQPQGKHRFRHRYGINKKYSKQLAESGIAIEGVTDDGMVTNISINNGALVGVQYHPELEPQADSIFVWFLKEAA